MTEEVWTDAACTTTLGRSVPRTASTCSLSKRSQACATKAAGRAKITARAADAVASHERRSRFRPAITTRTGCAALAAMSNRMRAANAPVPNTTMVGGFMTLAGRLGRGFLTRRKPLIRYVDDQSMAIGGPLISARPVPLGGATDG